MNNGVGIYLGLGIPWEDNLKYLNLCKKHGIKRFFTSLQIPEADIELLKKELSLLLEWSRLNKGEIIYDISPVGLKFLGMENLDLSRLNKMGINTIRIDDGYTCEEIAKFVHSGFKVILNASTCNSKLLESLDKLKVDLTAIEAMHNFYPKQYTGLNRDYFNRINEHLSSYGVQISSFIPDYHKPRGPLELGLPTLEEHRFKPLLYTYQHMISLGVDHVFVGDCLLAEKELMILGENLHDKVILPLLDFNEQICPLDKIRDVKFTTRPEITDFTWRLIESRALFRDLNILPEPSFQAKPGDILINNNLAQRYKGEIEINKADINYGDNYNLLGRIPEMYLNLLTCGQQIIFSI